MTYENVYLMDSPPSVRTQMRALSVVDLCYVLNDIIIFLPVIHVSIRPNKLWCLSLNPWGRHMAASFPQRGQATDTHESGPL